MKLNVAPLFMFVAAAAFADNRQGQESATRGLSFEDIKAACQNPARFHNQLAPSNIQVSCRDIQAKWVPQADGAVTMGTSRQITAALISDKYTVDPFTSPLKAASQIVACPKYMQVTETVETVRNVSCDEIVAYTGGGIEFCSGVIDALRAANANAVVLKETGKVVSFCGLAPAQGCNDQRGGCADQRDSDERRQR